MNIRIGPRSLNPISPPWNRYNRIFHALRGGKIFSRADQLCTKCNANLAKIRHSPIIMFQKYMSKGIKRLLWRIIIIFFPPSRSVLISFSSISFHRSDIALVNRYNQIFAHFTCEKFSLVGTSMIIVSFQF